MINQQTLQGNWNEIKGKLRSKWGQLTDDDVQRFSGNVDQLIGVIQRKTGEGRESIEHFLDQISSQGAGAAGKAGESVRTYAQQATESLQDTSREAAERVRERYQEAENYVRQRPGESLAVTFGAGLVTGLVAGLILRSR